MRNPYLATEVVVGKTTNIIKSDPVQGQMTFQDNVVTTPVTLSDLLGSEQAESHFRMEVAAITGDLQQQIDNIDTDVSNLQTQVDDIIESGGAISSYVSTVNDISGAITVVNGNGIEVTTLPNGQITISLYEDINISSFTGGSSNEIGSTVNSVDLEWTINKTETSQSINQGIGSLTVGVRDYNYATPITTNTTFTITAGDGTTVDTANTTVAFYHRRWWGTSANTSLSSAQILGLANNEFGSSRSKSFTINGNSEYIYYAYPAAWGTATFTVNGLLNTAWTLDVVSHTNASGHVENYNVYRTNTTQSGSGISIAVS